MLWCPNCKTEYREGFKTCSDCGSDLVEKPEQPPEAEESQYDREAFLASVGSQIEADMLEALLKANEIPVLMKYREAGDYLKIYMGGTNFGVDLYVPSHLLSNAQSIIEAGRGAIAEDSGQEGQEAASDAGQAGIPGAEGMGPGAEGMDPEAEGEGPVNEDGTEGAPATKDAETAQSEEDAFNRKRRFRTWVFIVIFSFAILIAAVMGIIDLVSWLIGRW